MSISGKSINITKSTNADEYSKHHNLQLSVGKKLFSSLNIIRGDSIRVLDMGCGTGELTAFIADTLSDNSEVVGVDPDLNRINKAIVVRDSRKNLIFIHGDSSSQFPRYNEPYYDIHFSNLVIQWLNPQEKELFFQRAFKILKPGGRIATLSLEKASEIILAFQSLRVDDEVKHNKPPALWWMSRSDVSTMLTKTGFEVISNEYEPSSRIFESMDQCLGWMSGTFYANRNRLSSSKLEEFVKRFTNEDGTVTWCNPTIYRIIAMKPLEKSC